MTVDEFLLLDFDTTLIIPLRTTLQLEGDNDQIIHHNDSLFLWRNGNKEFFPFLIVPVNEKDRDNLYGYSKLKIMKDVLEYLSLLNIRFGIKIDIHQQFFKNYSGNKSSLKEQPLFIPRIDLSYFWETRALPSYNTGLSQKESLLIGLFRDGFNSDNIFYSFLSFYKVFENYFSTYQERDLWIDSNFDKAKELWLMAVVSGFGDWDRFLNFVSEYGKSIGEYLYKKCRVSIAHSNYDPIINPNVFSDYYELYYANEVIKSLVWYLILTEFESKLKIE